MLEVRDLSVSYGQHRALEGISLRVRPGEIVVILGANGAGKSTLLRTIGGICEGRQTGTVDIDGQSILGLGSDRIVEHGIALVPEERGIFGDLSVAENLKLGAYTMRARPDEAANYDRVTRLFPKLGERSRQIVRTMSGGEQQMVAIGRAMMSNPAILMLDEPSLGLSPLLCKELFASLAEVRKAGTGILLVEQNAKQSLAVADRGYLLENGHIVREDTAQNLASEPAVQKAYLGAAGAKSNEQPSEAPAVVAAAVSDASGADTPAAPPTPPAPREIAAMAIKSVSAASKAAPDAGAPPLASSRFVPGAPQPRRSADQLLGYSVADLVGRIASPDDLVAGSETAPRPDRGPRAAIGDWQSHDDRLRAALRDIERAAKTARARVSKRAIRKPG